MSELRIKKLIKQGEGISVEFKECASGLNQSVFETICAFLNRFGGEILLGISDKKKITGIDKTKIEKIKKELVNNLNNQQVISPTIYLSIESITINGKNIIYIFVPPSSQVHKCKGKIYDRNEDGDFNITNNHSLISALYMNKQNYYTENKIYSYCKLSDLRADLIYKVRKFAVNQKSTHTWNNMSDMELLKSSKLYSKDFVTNKEGFTLAAILLFGKDETILSVIPHHKTDLILRIKNPDRYDDRDDVRTNLIDSFDRIMNFINKHLPDPFYTEKTQRISLREKIFREVASNILIHREYMNAFPAKIIIEKDKVYSENSNKPHGFGLIDVNNFSPFPKNPVIARVFKEIGFADELGSGIRNITKYIRYYSKGVPQLIEGDIFKIIIPIIPQDTVQDTPQDTPQDKINMIKEFCKTPKTRVELQNHLGLKDREHLRISILKPLLEKGILKMTLPDKPNSKYQKYYI